jgi:hypothetical protein
MEKIKKMFNILLVLVLLVSGWSGWFILQTFFPTHSFEWYPVIPVFFLIFGIVHIQILTRTKKENPRKVVNIYMIIRLSKMVLSFLLLGIIYLIYAKLHFRDFAFVFALFYFLYLGLETYFFYRTEKFIKNSL